MNEEEAIGRIAKLITTKFNNDYSIDNVDKEAIEELLKAYKELKEIEESLRKENEELKNQEATARRINELLVQRYSNSIPVQKVKDKIEELNENHIPHID